MNAAAVDMATELLEMIEGKWMTQAIGVAAELGIADLLASRNRDTAGLAAATGCDHDALDRLMRGLAALGICRQEDDGSYTLTAMGVLLTDEIPGSLRS